MEDLEINMKLELNAETAFKVEPEAEVKPDVQEVQEEFPMLMNLEAETKIVVQERHIAVEITYEVVGEPIMELEPLINNMFSESRSCCCWGEGDNDTCHQSGIVL